MNIAKFDPCLTDAQWAFLKRKLPQPKPRGRPPTDRRRIMDAVFYVVKGGLPWRLLPTTFPPGKTVWHVFRQWTRDRTWEALNACLRAHVRQAHGKDCRPTAAILDSQSVQSDGHGGAVGYDAAKRIKGRKRPICSSTHWA